MKQGQIYLPGHREPWYYLNTGTIIRAGQDGRWNYAAPAWEAMIKPVIAHTQPDIDNLALETCTAYRNRVLVGKALNETVQLPLHVF